MTTITDEQMAKIKAGLATDMAYGFFARNVTPATVSALIARVEVAEARVKALEEVYKAASGLCHGKDWNRGTHAIAHGYRAALVDAVRRARAALEGK